MRPPDIPETRVQLEQLDLRTLKAISILTSNRRRLTAVSTAVSTILALVAGVASAAAAFFPEASMLTIAIASLVLGVVTYYFARRGRMEEESKLDEIRLNEIAKRAEIYQNKELLESLKIIRYISREDV